MKRLIFVVSVIFTFLFLISYFLIPFSVRADEYQDNQKLLEQKYQELNSKQSQQQATEKNHNLVNEKILNLKSQISNVEKEIEKKRKLIDALNVQKTNKQKDLDQKMEMRNQLLKSFYESSQISPLRLYFSGRGFGNLAQSFFFAKTLSLASRHQVSSLGGELLNLKINLISNGELKAQLDKDTQALSLKKKDLDLQLASLTSQLVEVKGQISNIQTDIAKISARQSQILAEKTGGFQTSVGDVPAADDPASRPDFDPGFRPAYAGFSFGAPHRKGMSQYGSYGRAKSGQNTEDILRAYYPGTDLKKDYSTGIMIRVNDYGSYNIEDYVKRIYEVPNSWGDTGGYEALKAQAVAARSYALAYTNNGSGSICATESCQVFQSGNKGGNWERAVNDTKGWVLTSGGNPYSAWYAASSGGYNTPGGWDTKCGNQSCWTGEAYEKISGSPWFYKAWYKPRYQAATRSHPWLTSDEFGDIVNAVLLYQKDGGTISHLSQPDKSNPDTWSREQVRSQLGGEVVDRVDSINITYSQGGFTGNVHLDTDKGGKDIDGATFRQIFNLRAPGEIWLASSLYNLEKK